MHLRRTISISKKEVRHILRDPFTLTMAIFIPLFMVIAFGIAIDLDMHNVRIAVFDEDNTQASRMLIQTFTNSGYFEEVDAPYPLNPEKALASEKAKASLVIPKEFEEYLRDGKTAKAQILVDGSDSSTVGIIMNYIGGVLTAAKKKLFLPPIDTDEYSTLLPKEMTGVRIVERYLFNPEQKSPWFIVPGLSVVILSILSILLTALTIAREWETGSMELLLSTPVKPIEIAIGKMFPYLSLSLTGALLVYLVARFGFHIPFKGSYIYFITGTVLFLVSYLALGLLISAFARNQQLAMQMAILSGYMPSLLLSGFIFSIKNMPPFWQYFTMLFPARWYMEVARACYLKDAPFTALLPAFGAMAAIGSILIFMVKKRFRGSLEK